MNTIIVWNCFDEQAKFFVVEGEDLSRLDNVFINSTIQQEVQDELSSIMFDGETGEFKLRSFEHFPLHKLLIRDGFEKRRVFDTVVINAGMFP